MSTVGWEGLETEKAFMEGEAFRGVVGLLNEAEGLAKRGDLSY